MDKLYDAVAEILVNQFDVEAGKIEPDASFADINLDSLSQIELVAVLRKKFGIELTDDEMAELSVVSEIVTTLAEKGVAA